MGSAGAREIRHGERKMILIKKSFSKKIIRLF